MYPHCSWHRSHVPLAGSRYVLRMRRASLLRAGSGLSALLQVDSCSYCIVSYSFYFLLLFFLFSPLLPALLLLSLHSPCRLWPLWQPTDERSWVYSPLHYSAQLHSVSDEESDTVSVQLLGARWVEVGVCAPSARSAWPLAVWGFCMAVAQPGCLSGQLCAGRAQACSARAVVYFQLFGAGKALGSSGFPDMLPFLEDVQQTLWLCWEVGGTQT